MARDSQFLVTNAPTAAAVITSARNTAYTRWVCAANDAARRFYERLGYREVGRKVAYYGGREDALRMTHDLAVEPSSRAASP